ncbi:aspartate aminotransferase family protein (plasmid) [Arthrobacter sp. UC242_113]|uniref:aspartate aminotransferase family protein n=1 Tax=Arthrobacter sp. UC242_113 TaxID=3374550 RepID=UPI00375847F8
MAIQPYEDLLNKLEADQSVTPKNREALNDFLTYETPGSCLYTKWTNPPIIESGKGNKVTDVDGREYIDCITGMSSMNIGHGDERVAQVMQEQYMKLSHWFDFPTPERLKLVKRLCEITPGDFDKRVWLGLSGADAIDAILRLVRVHTGKSQIISFYGGYHGQNIGTMSLTTKAGMHRWYSPVPPADNGVNRFPYPYAYRCAYNTTSEAESAKAAVEAIDRILMSGENTMANYAAGINNVAAIIVEPMQCSAGYIKPHNDFLRRLRELADKHGILLVFDEIQTGMGRTGKMWGSEHSGVVPDLMAVGKALGGGVPMSAVVGRAEIFEKLGPGMSSNTYAGYALGCAVANKVLDIFEEDNLVERCAQVGEYMAGVLAEYFEKHPLVGSYDQTGVFLGIEYVKDRDTKEPALQETIVLCDALRDAGLLAQRNGYYGNRMSFIPPINITRDDVDEMFRILDEVTTKVEEQFSIGKPEVTSEVEAQVAAEHQPELVQSSM